MDGTNVRHLPAPPRGPHRGADPSGTVSVEIDDAARDVRVALAAGWRDRVGAGHLGEAVGEAVTEAVAARAARRPTEVADAARRDLPEFRPTQLYDTAVTVTDPGGRVRITVRGGQLVSVAAAGPWAEEADDADLAERLGEALRTALATVGDLPERALDGSSPAVSGRTIRRPRRSPGR